MFFKSHRSAQTTSLSHHRDFKLVRLVAAKETAGMETSVTPSWKKKTINLTASYIYCVSFQPNIS